MKKLLLTHVLLMLSTIMVSVFAQTATETSKFYDNIGIGVTAGASAPLDFNSVFPLNANAGIKVTKDFTPVVGMQIEGIAILNDNHFSSVKNVVKGTNVGANASINISNLILGYNGTPRTFEVAAVGGLGWLHTWNTSYNYLTSKTGLDLILNLGKDKAHSLVLTPAVLWNFNKYDAIKFDKNGAQLGLNLSYVYHLKTSNGTRHFKTYDIGAMNKAIDVLKEELAKKPKVVEVVKYVEKQVAPATNAVEQKGNSCQPQQWVVQFETNSAELSSEAQFILGQIGDNLVVGITATASPDGTEAYNKALSVKRASAVADFLSSRGVKVKSSVGNGVNSTTGRTAIVVTAQ